MPVSVNHQGAPKAEAPLKCDACHDAHDPTGATLTLWQMNPAYQKPAV